MLLAIVASIVSVQVKHFANNNEHYKKIEFAFISGETREV